MQCIGIHNTAADCATSHDDGFEWASGVEARLKRCNTTTELNPIQFIFSLPFVTQDVSFNDVDTMNTQKSQNKSNCTVLYCIVHPVLYVLYTSK